MRIAYHGGKCCGIKTICYLGIAPSAGTYAIKAKEGVFYDAQRSGMGHQSTDMNVFHDGAPRETTGERFDRYVDFMKNNQYKGYGSDTGAGLLEVVTDNIAQYVGGGKYTCQTDAWREKLEGHGFKAVTEFFNSNSGNTLTVWHLAYGDKNEKGE